MSASKEKNAILAAGLKKLANGDIAGVSDIYDEMSKDVYALALSKTDDENQAKNAMEEIFVLVYKYACRYRKDMNPYKWVMNIANNLTNRKFKSDVRLGKAIRNIKKIDSEYTDNTPDVLEGVKASCQTITQDMETLDFVQVASEKAVILKHAAIAVIAILAFIVGFAIGKPNGPKLSKEVEATVYLDATSSYTLTVNEDEMILDCEGADEYSKELLEGLNIVGTSLEDSIKYLTGSMYMNNELNGENATVLISVDAISEEDEDEVFAEVSKVFAEDNYDFSAILQKVDTDELSDAADEYEISVGKMGFVSLIIKASEELTGDDAKELSEKSIDELAAMYNGLVIVEDEDSSEEKVEKEEKAEVSEEAEEKEEVVEPAEENGIVVFIKDKAQSATDAASAAVEDAVDSAVDEVKDKAEDAVTDAANSVAEDIASTAGADEGTISEVKTYIKKIFARIFD